MPTTISNGVARPDVVSTMEVYNNRIYDGTVSTYQSNRPVVVDRHMKIAEDYNRPEVVKTLKGIR